MALYLRRGAKATGRAPWMISNLASTVTLGLLLGVKHALDADHVVAVSTIVSRDRRPWRAAVVGASWGMGHTLTLLAVGVVVLVFKVTIPPHFALAFEFAVGVMLVILGGHILWDFWRKRVHAHTHQSGETHAHLHRHAGDHEHTHDTAGRKSFLVGMVHGLAGSAALMLLVLGTLDGVVEGMAYIAAFGVASVVAMTVVSTAIGLPFTLRMFGRRDLMEGVRLIAGAVGVGLGVLVMIETGIAASLLAPY